MPYTAESMCEVIDRVFAGTDVVIAVRNRSYHSRLSPMRKMMSYGSKLLNRIFLNIRHTDTQGGLKGLSPRARGGDAAHTHLRFPVRHRIRRPRRTRQTPGASRRSRSHSATESSCRDVPAGAVP